MFAEMSRAGDAGTQKLKLVVKNGFLEVVDVVVHLKRARSDSDLWSSSVGRPLRAVGDASVAFGRDQSSHRSGTAPISTQGSFAAAADDHSSRGGFVDEDGHLNLRGWGDRSSSPSGTADRKGKAAGPTAFVVDDSPVGSDLTDRGKGDSGQAELAKLEWSKGAEGHATGNCTPCVHHNAKKGCLMGINCTFCHAPHGRKGVARPSKASRLQCRKFAEVFDTLASQHQLKANAESPDTETFLAMMDVMCPTEQKYLRSVLSARSTHANARNQSTANTDSNASVAPGRDRPQLSGTAPISTQGSLAAAADDHSSRGGFVDEDGHLSLRGWGDRSSSLSGTADRKGKAAGPKASVVDDSSVGSDLTDRGKGDSGQAELVKLEWSKGTERHATGNCTPCVYHNAKKGCLRGINCTFCHAPHGRKTRARPSKASRLQCKKLAEVVNNLQGHQTTEASMGSLDTDTYREVLSIMCPVEQKYMRSVLSARNRQTLEQEASGDSQHVNALAQAKGSPELAPVLVAA